MQEFEERADAGARPLLKDPSSPVRYTLYYCFCFRFIRTAFCTLGVSYASSRVFQLLGGQALAVEGIRRHCTNEEKVDTT